MPITESTKYELTNYFQRKLHTLHHTDSLDYDSKWTIECGGGCKTSLEFRVDNLLMIMRSLKDISCPNCKYQSKAWDLATNSGLKHLSSYPLKRQVNLECPNCSLRIVHEGDIPHSVKCVCQKPGREDELALYLSPGVVYDTKGFAKFSLEYWDDHDEVYAEDHFELHVDQQYVFANNSPAKKRLIEEFKQPLTVHQIRVPFYSLKHCDPTKVINRWVGEHTGTIPSALFLHHKALNRYNFIESSPNHIYVERFQ